MPARGLSTSEGLGRTKRDAGDIVSAPPDDRQEDSEYPASARLLSGKTHYGTVEVSLETGTPATSGRDNATTAGGEPGISKPTKRNTGHVSIRITDLKAAGYSILGLAVLSTIIVVIHWRYTKRKENVMTANVAYDGVGTSKTNLTRESSVEHVRRVSGCMIVSVKGLIYYLFLFY